MSSRSILLFCFDHMILVHFNETRAYTTEYLDLIRVRSSYAFFFQADQVLWAQKNLKIAYPISSLNLFLVHQLFVVFIASLVNCLFSYLSNHVSLKALHVVFLCVFFCFLQPSCVSTYKYDTFDCHCKEGFFGHYCEKGK